MLCVPCKLHVKYSLGGEGGIVHLGVLAWISLQLQLVWPHPNLTLLARQELGSLKQNKKKFKNQL